MNLRSDAQLCRVRRWRTHSFHPLRGWGAPPRPTTNNAPRPAPASRAREELREMPVQHTQMIGHRLQCAVTAFFAGRANMIAFDEQHLRDGLAHFIQGWRVVADLLPGYGGRGAGRHAPAVDID